MLSGQFKRFFVVTFTVAVLSFIQLGAFWTDTQATTKKDVKLTVLYTTDLYGALRDFRCKRPGVPGGTMKPADIDFANLLYQVNRVRKDVVQKQQLPPPLLFNTGDNLATGLAARFLLEFEGLAGVDFVADVFERFGYNLIGIGNHEFSVPPKKLHDFLMQARLKGLMFSAANLEKAPKDHALKKFVNRDGAKETKYFIFQRGGVKVGVFHVVPNELQKKVARTAVKGVTFGDPSSVVGELVPKLRDELNVDVVIVLSHIGKKSQELANSTAGIDLIITNDLRLRYTDPNTYKPATKTQALSTFDKQGRGVHIVGSAKYGRMLGRVDLVVRKTSGAKSKVISFRADSIPLHKKQYEPELRRELVKWESSYCKRWGNPIGNGRIRNKKGMSRKQFMDYILNLIRKKTKTEIAFINTGAVRKAPFPLKGYITKDDLYRALPFTKGSTIEIVPLKGSDISGLLDSYWDVNKPNSRKALHFAGVENGPNGTTINGRAIDDAGTYWVTTISYVAKESSGWITVPKKKRILLKYTDGSAPMLRRMMLHHFARDRYRKLHKESMPPKPKAPIDPETGEPKKGVKLPPPKPFTKSEIPYNGNFVNLADRIAAKAAIEASIGLAAIFIDPINIGTFYTQKDTLSGGFYQKFQMNFSITARFQAETRMHLWKNELSVGYDVDQSAQWTTENGGRIGQSVFQENNDLVTIRSEYRFRYFETVFPGRHEWYYTSPFVEALLETEMTRGSRPDIDKDEDFFKLGLATERFRHFEVRAKAGLSFKINDYLSFRVGAAGRREFALEYKKQNENTAQVVRTEFNFGFSADFELQSWQFLTLGSTTFAYEAKAEYLATGIVGDPNKSGIIHDFTWTNSISMALSSALSVALGLKFYVYQGLFPINPNDENSAVGSGPVAFRFEPTITLRFNAQTRGQTF
tara:strand:+ start:3746 stop:6511 length:2766 start_codon:yes stop_codon:yes gene_type:complete